jgi:tripartite ATP-independent transporter DctP family solute receptor
MRHTLAVVVALAVVTALAAGPAGPAGAADKVGMKICHIISEKNHNGRALEVFVKRVGELTQGRIDAKAYHAGALGSETQCVESLQLGSVQAGVVTSAVFISLSPPLAVLDLPYIFRDWEHFFKVVDGPIGEKIAEQAPKRGVRVLGYWIGGVRDSYGNRAVRNPDDFKGMKLRTMQTPLYVALFKAYGAIPTPIAWPETYLALAQGTVDGAETALVAMHDNKQYEVVKYATRTKHAISAAPFVVSERWWQGLAPDLQKAVLAAEQETRKLARENFFEYDRTVVDDLKKRGMTVVEPDLAPFRAVALKIYPQFEKEIGRETIQAVLEAK